MFFKGTRQRRPAFINPICPHFTAMYRKLFLCTFCLATIWTTICPVNTAAGTLTKADSLLSVYEHASATSDRLAAAAELLSLCDEHAAFFSEPPQLTAGTDAGRRDLYVWFAADRFYTSTSYYSEALTYSERALPLAERSGEDDIYATLLADRCYCLYKTSDYEQATIVGQQAVEFSEAHKNTMQLSRAYLYLAIINYAHPNFDEAIKLVEKSIETNLKLGVNIQTHNCYGIACEIYCGARQLDKAEQYGLKAVEAARAIGSESAIANHLTQLSYTYDRMGRYEEGLRMADEAIDIVRRTEPLDRNQLAISLEMKSWNLIDLHRNAEAVEALHEAIALERKVGNAFAVCYDYRTLYEAYEPIDLRQALQAMKTYTKMSDSLHTVQLKELQSKVNVELHVDDLEQRNEQTRRMNTIIIVSATAIVLLLVLAIALLLWALNQRKRTETALKKLTQVREDFFTNVTHEFRTPLTVILGLSEELQKTSLPQSQQETVAYPREAKGMIDEVHTMAATIQRQGRHLLELISRLLDISKVKSALGEQQLTYGNLPAHIEMIVEWYQELARQKQLTLLFENNTPPLETDFVADYIEKIADNLLSNAIKYTPAGGIVKACLTHDGKRLHFTVSDTGIGIAEEHLPHIFDPFYRADNSYEGSGVGLALVKQVVEALGGDISVRSELGKGTTFEVTLPVESSGNGVNDGNDGNDVNDEEQPLLLIVEDNADVASLIARQLAPQYTMHYATNGRQGIEMAQQLIPDIILTDVMMPDTDGLQLCRTLRENEQTNHIPIVIITAKATEEDKIRGLKAGADAYLIKPFNAEELNIRVENLLRSRAMLQEKYDRMISQAAIERENNTQRHSPRVETLSGTSEEGGPHEADNEKMADRYSFEEKSDDFIGRLNAAIDAQLERNDFTVETLADEMYMSVPTLRRKLTAVTGIKPKRYILNVRLEKARQMLQDNPKLTVNYVAETLGFYDISHFVRMFRLRYGKTPADARG